MLAGGAGRNKILHAITEPAPDRLQAKKEIRKNFPPQKLTDVSKIWENRALT